MKILFRTMRYNWRYIFSKSNKIAVALFSVWGFVTLVTPTDIMLNCIDNIKAIASLVKYISERSQGFSTYMPVIGTGGADAGSVNDLVVYIVKTIELFKDEIDCDIHIVVSDKEEKLGLMNLKML